MSRSLLTLAFTLLLIQGQARAGFVVTVGDVALSSAGVGSVDVAVRSDDGTAYPITAFGLQLQITNLTSGGTTQLAFASSLADAHLTDSNYIFFGNSQNVTFSQPSGVLATTAYTRDTYIGGDGADNTLPTSVGTTSFLLARLDLTGSTGAPPQAGDRFAISVIADNTFFLDEQGQFVSFTSGSGTASMPADAVTAVPEPSSLALAGLAVLAAGAWNLRRRAAWGRGPCPAPKPPAGGRAREVSR